MNQSSAASYTCYPIVKMPAEKTDAIVLRVVDFSESSCVVTLMTRDFGKISALAKGARRRKSPFEAALDVLALCRIVFLHKMTDALDLLTEAKLERRFRSAVIDLNRLYAGYYFVELASAMTDEGDPHPEVFELLDTAIARIDQGESVQAWILRFEMRMLALLGHLPSFDNCVGCGDRVPDELRTSFGLIDGGLFCRRCRPGKKSVASVRADDVRALAQFAEESEDWQRSLENEGDDDSTLVAERKKQWGRLRGLNTQYFSHLLGYRPRTIGYINRG